MEHVERIQWEGKALAYIIRTEADPGETTFVTPPELNFQVGFVAYSAGGEVARHEHAPLERSVTGTSELLLVKNGRCEVDIYNEKRERVATRELAAGDVVLLVDGGHGFRMLDDTVLLEIKQGPYIGVDEKERF
ncbi:MAG: cupin domain-containing protein [Planctomycetota bacterium]